MSDGAASGSFSVSLQFHGDLPLFLKRRETAGRVTRVLSEKTSIKDVIEACGVPHPQIDLILFDGRPVSFEFHVTQRGDIQVFPIGAATDRYATHRLQWRHHTRFVADGHLGKLARDLRLLGFDVVHDKDAEDAALVTIAVDEERALLTRDRRLLMHAAVRDGYCPRSDGAESQINEVVRRFELQACIRPYTRCLLCNGMLARVSKEQVIDRLEPLTKIYYEDFRECENCRHVYWSGSHFSKLEARLDRIRRAAATA